MKKKTNLGEKLRQLREAKNLGLKTAAPKADVTYSYLSKIENGHKNPTSDLLEKLCDIYDADKDEIIARFGGLPDDIQRIIQQNGKEVFDLLREKYKKEGAKNGKSKDPHSDS